MNLHRSPPHTHLPTSSSLQENMAHPTNPSADVVLYVGKHRHPYHVNSDTLSRSSAFFHHLLGAAPHLRRDPILVDCEEGIFESLLLLMRYGTLEALPPMSASETFRLRKEAEFYGVAYTEPCPRTSEALHSDCSSSDLSSCGSPSGSPKSMMHMSPPPAGNCPSCGRYSGAVRIACTTPRQLAELREFPAELADPSRLLLVSCLDQEKASIYTCDCARSRDSGAPWAINFHHRHAFCTACGCRPNWSPKHFAEMFMAAATKYADQGSPGQASLKNCPWRVSCDSTCVLRFIRSAGDGPDACGCSASGGRAGKEAQPTIWGANYFYSHAFCTCCGAAAKGAVLVSLLLAIRYGRVKVSPPSSTMDSPHKPAKSL